MKENQKEKPEKKFIICVTQAEPKVFEAIEKELDSWKEQCGCEYCLFVPGVWTFYAPESFFEMPEEQEDVEFYKTHPECYCRDIEMKIYEKFHESISIDIEYITVFSYTGELYFSCSHYKN